VRLDIEFRMSEDGRRRRDAGREPVCRRLRRDESGFAERLRRDESGFADGLRRDKLGLIGFVLRNEGLKSS